jgi:hypothetical protein
MKIPVLIEKTPEQRYRATGGEPFCCSVEADSAKAALDKLRQLIDDRVAQGACITALDLPDGENPWLEGAGMFRNDPLFDDWQQAIADYRRKADQQADAP